MSPDPDFNPTKWSLIAAVRLGEQPRAGQALEALCQAYWYPLYAYVRRLGHSREDAADLTQGFFVHLMDQNLFASANPERGRLRNLLLTSIKRFLRDDCRRQHDPPGDAGRGGFDSRGAGRSNGPHRWFAGRLSRT